MNDALLEDTGPSHDTIAVGGGAETAVRHDVTGAWVFEEELVVAKAGVQGQELRDLERRDFGAWREIGRISLADAADFHGVVAAHHVDVQHVVELEHIKTLGTIGERVVGCQCLEGIGRAFREASDRL